MNVPSRSLGWLAVTLSFMASISTISAAGEKGSHPGLKDPRFAAEKAPDSYKVKVETTKGDFVIEVDREWAPNGADRFYNLVTVGYYKNTAFYRVIPGFMAQVGMNGDPDIQAAWSEFPIKDDPILKDNTRGMVTFAAKSVPNSRTTQIFVNYGDNTYLKRHGRFSPFGQVVEGMQVVDSLYSGYGEGAPSGKGPSQAEINRHGNAYLKKEFPELDYITRATIVTE